MWAQILLQFYTDSLETSLVFLSSSDNLHAVWVYPSYFFFVTFLQVELSYFSGIIYNKVNGQGLPCGHNSSYSFILILWKLHWCFGHRLVICMWFGYNPHIFFVTFLQVKLSHFSSIFYNNVNGQGILCGHKSSYSFLPILSKFH